jgi:hypothetical protein
MRSAQSISPSDLALAKEFAHQLLVCRRSPFDFAGATLRMSGVAVTLFGSRARGDADEESMSCFSYFIFCKLSRTQEAA